MNRLLLPALCALLMCSAAAFPALAQDPVLELTKQENGLFTIRAENVTFGEVMQAMEEHMDNRVTLDPNLARQVVNLTMKDASYEKLMDSLAGSYALIWERVGDELRLVSANLAARYEQDLDEDLSWGERREHKKKVKEVKRSAKRVVQLFDYAGKLDYDEAKALVQQRKQAMDDEVDRLVALGPGGARAINDAYEDAGSTRGQLVMIQALQKIDDPQAAKVLGSVFAKDKRLSLQVEAVAALGQRASDPEARRVIKDILQVTEDKRIKTKAAQALFGQEDSLDEFVDILYSSEESELVKLEALTSLAAIQNDESLEVLAGIAGDDAAGLKMQKNAIKAMARYYPQKAGPYLEELQASGNPAISGSAANALTKAGTYAAGGETSREASEEDTFADAVPAPAE